MGDRSTTQSAGSALDETFTWWATVLADVGGKALGAGALVVPEVEALAIVTAAAAPTATRQAIAAMRPMTSRV